MCNLSYRHIGILAPAFSRVVSFTRFFLVVLSLFSHRVGDLFHAISGTMMTRVASGKRDLAYVFVFFRGGIGFFNRLIMVL